MKQDLCDNKSMIFIALFLFIFMFGNGLKLHAAPVLYDYPFESYPDIGPINAITQSSNGMIWISGQRGLLRYEGERFKRYGLSEGLNSEYVYSVHERDDGTLFACTWRGLHRYYPDEDRWKVLPVRANEPVRDIYFLKNELLLATDDGAILVKGMAEYRLPLTDPDAHFHLWGPSYSIAYDEKNDLVYLGTEYHGVVSFPLDKFRPFWIMKDSALQQEYETIGRKAYIEKYHADPDSHSVVYAIDNMKERRAFCDSLRKSWKTSQQLIPVKKLVLDDDGSIVFFNNDGLFRIQNDNLSRITFDEIKDTRQLSTLAKMESQIAIANYDGIFLLDDQKVSGRIQHKDGLVYGRITSIFRDRDKVLWIGSDQGGIQKQVSEAFNRFYIPKDFSIGDVKKVLPYKSGLYLIGSNGIAQFIQGQISKLYTCKHKNVEIIDATLDQDGNFLIARSNGLFLLKDGVPSHLLSINVPPTVQKYFFTMNDEIWFHNGQETYSWKNGRLRHVNLQGKIYLYNTAKDDASGNIFIGSWAGLLRYSGNDLWLFSKNSRMYCDLTDKSGKDWCVDYAADSILVKDDGILASAFGPDSVLYLGTLSGGIIKFQNETIAPVYQDDGKILYGSFPEVFIDKNAFLYFHGNLEVVKLDSSGFKRLDGVNPLQASIRHVVEDEAGRKYVVTSRNTTILANDEPIFNIKPNYGFSFDALVDVKTVGNKLYYILRDEIIYINIDDLLHENEVHQPVIVSAEFSDSSYYNFDNLELPLGVRSIKFNFALPSFVDEQDHLYSWYLDGIESEFSPWEESASVKYERLPPGSYIFHLRASNSFGQVAIYSNPVHIHVLPYFYETVTFLIISIIAGILLIILSIRIAHWNILRINRKLEERVLERTRELEDAYLELEASAKSELEAERLRTVQNLAVTISHEFNNPLAILSTAAQLLGMFDKKEFAEKPRKIVDRIPPAVERLSKLVQKMNNLTNVHVSKYADSIDMINFEDENTDSDSKKN